MSEAPKTNPTAPFRPSPPLVIGLVGGVASGKSSVARLFESRGLRVLDADVEARRAVADPAVLSRIEARFGSDVLAPDGTLDRQRLAEIVFNDPPARRDLEAITHPVIRVALEAALEAAARAGVSVVLDAPLLLEGGLVERCDVCIFVEAPEASRRARAEARGWQPDELARREANQLALTVKKSRCRYTIRNDASLESTDRQVAELLRSFERVT